MRDGGEGWAQMPPSISRFKQQGGGGGCKPPSGLETRGGGSGWAQKALSLSFSDGVVVVGANTPPLLETTQTRNGGECWAKKVDEEGETPPCRFLCHSVVRRMK